MANGKTISRAELEGVKRAIYEAETGRPRPLELVRARNLCASVGAEATLDVVQKHIDACARRRGWWEFLRSVAAGIVAGTIVWSTIGRRGGK